MAMRRTILSGVTAFGAVLLLGCDSLVPVTADLAGGEPTFPKPDRPVAKVVSNQFANEDARDQRNEAQVVMDLAKIRAGMTVADIGAGEGYYTVRLADRVGADGRVLAQDISREALERLGRRVEKDRLENISIKLGDVDDPQLPPDSFDRVFMVHMYHEVAEPYAFLWNLWPALNSGGQIIVVEADSPVGRHGLPHTLLFCEFEAVGYVLVEYIERPDIKGYFARFQRGSARTAPEAIKVCDAG
ncbi:SAM-dependent methyltransferase [Porphyrobacter sp. HT-58-2]|uniref:class I SAM-dependent methyltransferase n=1 Tax=Porphyrobacter sp. HT-58-2 TaxID=2023229 RepID=UPI000CDC8746|nr:class I SAM-dependent methyltransferase [Porphyrobacter sp. HT-58-2]AUX70025.1 SAM-dependent methyltransferase [Porphyrobacter sp. HT-58-2]